MSLTTLLKIWFSWNSDSQLQLFIDILCSWNDQCLGCNFMEINAMIWKDLGVNLSSPTRKRSAEEWSDNIGSVTVCDAHVYWFLVRSCRGCDQRDLSRAHSAATITIRKMVATDCRCQTSHCSLRLPRRRRDWQKGYADSTFLLVTMTQSVNPSVSRQSKKISTATLTSILQLLCDRYTSIK